MENVERRASRARGRGSFYASNALAAEADGVSSISVEVSFHPAPEELEVLRQAIAFGAKSDRMPRMALQALKSVAGEILSRGFAAEFDKVIDAYRVFLRESLAKGEDAELKAALNRARLQEKILASTSMVDQAQACQLLGMSTTNPSATMKRKEDKRELLRFTVDGRAVYPLVQFDVEGRRVFPAVAKLLAAKPDHWSDFRLLHWLTRPHLDFDGTPGEALGTDEPAVLAAFAREIEPAVHG
jgi:hypothetical protein